MQKPAWSLHTGQAVPTPATMGASLEDTVLSGTNQLPRETLPDCSVVPRGLRETKGTGRCWGCGRESWQPRVDRKGGRVCVVASRVAFLLLCREGSISGGVEALTPPSQEAQWGWETQHGYFQNISPSLPWHMASSLCRRNSQQTLPRGPVGVQGHFTRVPWAVEGDCRPGL